MWCRFAVIFKDDSNGCRKWKEFYFERFQVLDLLISSDFGPRDAGTIRFQVT